jgi:hypothetical protein
MDWKERAGKMKTRIFLGLAAFPILLASCGNPTGGLASSSAALSSSSSQTASLSEVSSSSAESSTSSEGGSSSSEESSSEPAPTYYSITKYISGSGSGDLFLSLSSAFAGAVVQITVLPGEHSVLKSLTSEQAFLASNDGHKTYTFTMPASNVLLNAVFDLLPTYSVSFAKVDHVSFALTSATSNQVYAGDKVTFTATPAEFYALKEVKEASDLVSITAETGNNYSFVMPASTVTITATLEYVPASAQLTLSCTSPELSMSLTYQNLTRNTSGTISSSSVVSAWTKDVVHITLKTNQNHTILTTADAGIEFSESFAKTAFDTYEGEITLTATSCSLGLTLRLASAINGTPDFLGKVNLMDGGMSAPTATWSLNGGVDGSGSHALGSVDDCVFDAVVYDVILISVPAAQSCTFRTPEAVLPNKDAISCEFTMPGTGYAVMISYSL